MADILTKPFEQRKELSKRMIEKYPDRVPVVILESEVILRKEKFLPNTTTMWGQFLFHLKKENSLIANSMDTYVAQIKCGTTKDFAAGNGIMGDLYSKYKDTDGFLKVVLVKENVFG